MFGLGRSTYRRVEDVVVEDATEVRIVDPQDVFVERGAVDGELRIEGAGDVHVQGRSASHPSPSRDCVVDDGDDATVKSCEDVLVRANAVTGDLVVEDSGHDVFTKQTDGVVTEGVEDVRFEGGVDRSAAVRIRSAQDVRFERGAVGTDVTAEDVEDVLQQSAESVAGGVEQESPASRAPVHIESAEDLLVDDAAIEGTVVAADPEDVALED